jgi:hypothetical protein
MFLKSPDPTAHAVTMGGRVYPVRDGVFLVGDDLAPELTSTFEPAESVREGLAQELVDLGSSEAAKVREPQTTAAVQGAPGATVDLGPLHEKLAAAHERIDELADRLEQLEQRLVDHLEEAAGDEPKGDDADAAKDAEPKGDESKTGDEPKTDKKPARGGKSK